MTEVDRSQPSAIGVGWKHSHWCTRLLGTEPSARCFSRDIVVQSRNGLLAAVCGNCGSVRRTFQSDAAVEHHIRLLRLDVHRPQRAGRETGTGEPFPRLPPAGGAQPGRQPGIPGPPAED